MRAKLAKDALAGLLNYLKLGLHVEDLNERLQRSLEFWRKLVVSVREGELTSNIGRLRSLEVHHLSKPDVEKIKSVVAIAHMHV